ncbi:hypothetical protein M8C21_002777 [Ambrosia artemisiifolia]|uniref:Xyloglucan endotransglucosylase/hydrolase n=1 Tax=Ambrosia artemisiifolia TaxID=4212 RepID=A0AAD5GPY3_AMBAR|nr:hypothetical protein M8C21_002777 [Ambrosia artemisiifolia]
MASSSSSLLVPFLLCFAFSVSYVTATAKFDQMFQPYWAPDHFSFDGDAVNMKLDNFSGAGFSSKSKYMFGRVNMQIKLVGGDSAGTVTAFYMSSEGPKHHEFDFEFLGNTTGEPYVVQTNVYVNGVGNREQRFLVDDTPIRVHTNLEHKGIPYPKDQAMGVYSSIWNADDWATQGGRVKTDWTHAPFVASYRGFEIDGCECPVTNADEDNAKRCANVGGWWDQPLLSELNVHQSHQLIWVRANHMIYDYCSDTDRFPSVPLECEHHRH